MTALVCALLGVAAIWTLGGFLSGPLHLGYLPFRGGLRRPVLTGLAFGLLAGAIFLIGALIVRLIPPLHDFVENVLAHARYGSLPLIVLVGGFLWRWLIRLRLRPLARVVVFAGVLAGGTLVPGFVSPYAVGPEVWWDGWPGSRVPPMRRQTTESPC